MKRRDLLTMGALLPLATVTSRARGEVARVPELCLMHLSEITSESEESPFFEHYHQLSIPVSAFIAAPSSGLIVRTSPVDQGSFDQEGFARFIQQTGLNLKALQTHVHDVHLSQDILKRVASGEKRVEVRVVSDKGNYVHNFFLTASRSALIKIKRGHT